MGNGTSLFIIVVTLANIAGCLWLIWWTSRRNPHDASASNTTGHVWDGDLSEYNNPMPRWWLGLFLLTILFGFLYLALYPGLGTFKGLLGWSSTGQYKAEQASADALYGPVFAKYGAMEIPAIAKDPQGRGATVDDVLAAAERIARQGN